MKVFNVSPHRSGTRSFHSFCCAHGLASAHWCGPEQEAEIFAALAPRRAACGNTATGREALLPFFGKYYDGAQVFADFPTPLLYRSFIDFEGSDKFILVRRDPEAWVRSVRRLKWNQRAPLTFLEREFYFILTRNLVTSLDDLTDQQLAYGYSYFIGRAFRDMADCMGRFLAVDLTDKEIGPKIAAFIGFEQRYPFPVEADA